MKRFLLGCIFVASHIAGIHATMQEPEIMKEPNVQKPSATVIKSPNQHFVDMLFINIMNEHLSAAYKDINRDDMLTRKKSNTASILLAGLAQSCAHLGSIVGADSKKEKQQGMLNVAGTVLAVAAQLAAHSPKPVQQPETTTELAAQPAVQPDSASAPAPEIDAEMVSKLAILTDYLIKECEQEQLKSPADLPPMLSLIRSFPDAGKRQELIAIIMATPGHAAQYLMELFGTLYNYTTTAGASLVEFIKDRITYYFESQPAAQEATTETIQDQDLTENRTPVKSQKRLPEPEELDYLADCFITMLQSQLKQVVGIDQSATNLQVIAAMYAAVLQLYAAQ